MLWCISFQHNCRQFLQNTLTVTVSLFCHLTWNGHQHDSNEIKVWNTVTCIITESAVSLPLFPQTCRYKNIHCTHNWLWAGWSGDRIPVEVRFSAPVQIGPGAHPASCTMATRSFPGVKSCRGLTLTPHPLLVPWSRNSRAIPILPLWAVWPVQSLSACTTVHFTLPYSTHRMFNIMPNYKENSFSPTPLPTINYDKILIL